METTAGPAVDRRGDACARGSAPGVECPPDCHELSHVIRGVIESQENLPQIGLSIAVRDQCLECDGRIANQRFEPVTIALVGTNALVPRVGSRGCSLWGPVVIRPRRCLVRGIATEFQNVVLRESEVLEQLPGRVRESCRSLAPQVGRESRDSIVQRGVGFVPGKGLSELVADHGRGTGLGGTGIGVRE
jgi:hypothetical protein